MGRDSFLAPRVLVRFAPNDMLRGNNKTRSYGTRNVQSHATRCCRVVPSPEGMACRDYQRPTYLFDVFGNDF